MPVRLISAEPAEWPEHLNPPASGRDRPYPKDSVEARIQAKDAAGETLTVLEYAIARVLMQP